MEVALLSWGSTPTHFRVGQLSVPGPFYGRAAFCFREAEPTNRWSWLPGGRANLRWSPDPFVISGGRANLRWVISYTLSTKLNRKTGIYKETYLIGATKEHTPSTLYLCSLLPCLWMCVGWSGVVWHGKGWHPPYIGTHTLLDEWHLSHSKKFPTNI